MGQNYLVIYEEEIEKIEKILNWLIKNSQAKCALLVDKDGHLITRQGFTHSLDTTALAALLAGSFASTKEIARLVGEPEFSVLFHQGKKDHIHICLAGERSILAVLFDDRTTIGLVRLYSKQAADELTAILAPSIKEKREKSTQMVPDFSTSLENKLDDIFSE